MPMPLSVQIAHDPPGKAEYPAQTGQFNQLNVAALARFKTHGGASRNVQAHAPAFAALEHQRIVGFKEVVVRTDLNRPIATVGHFQGVRASAGV